MTPRTRDGSPRPGPHQTAVVGLQWGDEGKGKIVDVLTGRHDVIVRYNGGANAGHTVVIGSDRYALHLIPAGILSPGKLCVIANGVVVDPEVLIQEIEHLRSRGVEVGDNLCVSDRAHVVKHEVPCSPCFQRVCPLGHFDCMMKLAPSRVLDEIHRHFPM